MALTLQQVRHVAGLARLALTPDEEQRFTTQLSAILDAVAELEGVDTTGVEPTLHAALAGAPGVRADQPRPSLGPEAALANAPARVDTRFAVPKIIE
ncbi:MAG: Asp-tRNA(Asn)/Glu-tRNA(Gln) amidotransferase subunit GatC [Myxococcota bacterium]|nr:Asp-tRNA(Asn)/Glu-tRNA(Gln) amidotransferase subunit GatC [Myxococcota bacterium]